MMMIMVMVMIMVVVMIMIMVMSFFFGFCSWFGDRRGGFFILFLLGIIIFRFFSIGGDVDAGTTWTICMVSTWVIRVMMMIMVMVMIFFFGFFSWFGDRRGCFFILFLLGIIIFRFFSIGGDVDAGTTWTICMVITWVI